MRDHFQNLDFKLNLFQSFDISDVFSFFEFTVSGLRLTEIIVKSLTLVSNLNSKFWE